MKPSSTALASAVALNDYVHDTFEESQVFRIRPLPWARRQPKQSCVSLRQRSIRADLERTSSTTSRSTFPKPGSGSAGELLRSTGAYKHGRDHLFQVMAFVVMEPPTGYEPACHKRRKNKVFGRCCGQMFGCGSRPVRRVTEETGVAKDSTPRRSSRSIRHRPTALGGVPIYLAPARRWPSIRIISIAFKEAPRTMFRRDGGRGPRSDHLTFDLADRSKFRLSSMASGRPGYEARQVSMQFSSQEIDSVADALEAYERLILDAMPWRSLRCSPPPRASNRCGAFGATAWMTPTGQELPGRTWGLTHSSLIAPNAWRLPFERGWAEKKS